MAQNARMTAAAARPDDELQRLLCAMLTLEEAENLTREREPLERVAELARVQGCTRHTFGRLQFLLGRMYAHLGEYERGYACAIDACDLLEREGDVTRAMRARVVCVAICIETGQIARSLEHSRPALAWATASADVITQVKLLNNQATAFCCVEEWEAAASCAEEAVCVGNGHPAARGSHEFSIASLAAIRTHLAETLELRGRPADAQLERRRAEQALAALGPTSALRSLYMALYALSRLGKLEQARAMAGMFFRRVRQFGSSPIWRSHALEAMGHYHLAAGRLDKAASRMERAVGSMRATGRVNDLPETMRQLATIHAKAGRHGDALHWLRQTRMERLRLHVEHARLHCRLAALEREVQRRRVERETELLHLQRLAVVGRLMAQIYHLLQAPLAAVHTALARCIEHERGRPDGDLHAVLQEVLLRLGEAISLARQLKMFSYRTTAQTMVLDLASMLREAWRGIGIVRPCPPAELVLQGEPAVQVRGDAQRLAVLLRILFIEIERMGASIAPRVSLSTQGRAVRVEFAFAHGAFAAPAPGVGLTLCEEIAHEMQGALWRIDSHDATVRLTLDLPAETDSAGEDPGP